MQEQHRQELEQMQDALQLDFDVCEDCGCIYNIALLKPGNDFNDFHMRYCPFCGHTEF